MATNESCGTCRFWLDPDGDESAAAADYTDRYGCCRRYPPVIIERAYHENGAVVDLTAEFPETGNYDWCGEWAAKDQPGEG